LNAPQTIWLHKRLALRNLQPELMDDPSLPSDQHAHALRGLTTIHRFSGLVNRFWNQILPFLNSHPDTTQPITVADVGCGDGYLLRQLAKKSAAAGLKVRWIGCDFSDVALELANRKSAAAKTDIQFQRVDILTDTLPQKVDLIVNSLFLHHFTADQVQTILTKFRDATTQGFIVEDLRRTVLGYTLAWTVGRLLTRSPIVHYDGPVSVEGAFTIPEILDVISRTELSNVKIDQRWPQRFVLTYCH
jgi:SAM-dependent methyltransferase